MVWWKTAGKVAGGVVVALVANYHLSTPPVDMAKLREQEVGRPVTPLVYPEDMDTTVVTRFINSIGDTAHNLFGYDLFRVDNSSSRATLEKLKEVLPEEEYKEIQKPFVLMNENMDPKKGVPPFHIMILSSFTEKILKARYMVEKTYLENKEEYDKQELKPQIIITGLPRTGSTFLHQLLAQDPNCRFLSSWEQQAPVPFPTKETYENDVRIKQFQGYQLMADKFVRNYNKYFRMYHDVDGAQVEEELFILLHSLTMPCALPWSQDHWEWYVKPNKFAQYAYLRKFLKMSQYHHPPRSHFVLKSPLHGWHFGELLHTFPTNRVIVVTHRDPTKVVGSLAKLQLFVGAFGLRSLKNDPTMNKETFGKQMVYLTKTIADSLSKVRKEIDPQVEKDLLDVEFNDLVSDPMKVVERIYDQAGLELTEEAREVMANYLAENAKQRKTKGSSHCPYTLEEFGLTAEEVNEAFADYRKERGYK